MNELSTTLLVGMLVWLAGVLEASPQTERTSSPSTQLVVRQTRKTARSRDSLAAGAISAAAPGLCFQPGVGWQSILPEAPGAPGSNHSMEREGVNPTSVAHAPSSDGRLSAAKQAPAIQCAGLPANKGVLAADREKFNLLHLSGTMRPAGLAQPGEVASRRANSPLTSPTYPVSAAESDARTDQAGARPFRAYISSIKLRRLIRNAPDFQTRLQLQQLQSSPPSQPHKARSGAKTGTGHSRPPQGERTERTSSRGMAISDRPQSHSHGLEENR